MRLDSCKLWTAVMALGMGCLEPREGVRVFGNVAGEAPPQQGAQSASGDGTAEETEVTDVQPTPAVEHGPSGAGDVAVAPLPDAGLAQAEPGPAPIAGPARKVEIELTQPVDDFVYASVDGQRKRVWYINEPEQQRRSDVTSWFAAGEHTLRLQAINTVGPTTFGLRVWVDGALALDAQCPAEVCNGSTAPGGILLDRSLALTTAGPAPQQLHVTSAAPGKLYIDDVFTGLTTTGTDVPVSLSLPPGEHVIGLGVSDDTPPAYSGSYFERTITLGEGAVAVDFAASEAPLPVQELTRIALVPVRNLVVDTFDEDEVGVLSDEDVDTLEELAVATRDEWLEPFSYGLVSWDLELLPVVEDVALHARTHEEGPDADTFLREAGLEHLRDEYEIVLLYYDLLDEDGTLLSGVVDGEQVEVAGIALGGGNTIWFNTLFVGIYGEPTGPNPALLHEALHNYEGYNERDLHFYLGADGLHGGDEHGYYSGDGGELDFALFQRLYMRNQIAEASSTRLNEPVSFPPPEADLWVGVFDTLRRGYSPL